MADGARLGRSYVEIAGDESDLLRALQNSESKVTAFADKAQQEANRSARGLDLVAVALGRVREEAKLAAESMSSSFDDAGASVDRFTDKLAAARRIASEGMGQIDAESRRQLEFEGKLDTELANRKRRLDDIAMASQKAGNTGKRSFSEMADSLQQVASRQVGVITGFAGIVAATAAVAVGAFRMGQSIRRALEDAQAKEFREDIDSISDSLKSSTRSAASFSENISPGVQAMRDVRKATADAEQDVISLSEQLIRSRSLLQRLADTARFGADGFTGAQSSIAQNAQRELEEIAAVGGDAQRRVADSNRKVIDEALRATRRGIRETLDPLTELEQENRRINAEISSLEGLLGEAGASQREEIEKTIEALQDLKKELGRRAVAESFAEFEADVKRVTEEATEQAEQLRNETEAIRRESLEPLQQQVLAAQDRVAELQDKLGEVPEALPDLRDAIVGAIEAQNNRIDQLRREAKEQSEQQSRDTIEGFRRVIDESAARFGLDQIFQQLAIVAQNTRPD